MTNSQAASHESWLVRYSPALQDLVEAIPIVSDNGLPILTENNFHSPSFIWTPRLLIFRLSVGPPHFLFMKTPRAPPVPYYLEQEITSKCLEIRKTYMHASVYV